MISESKTGSGAGDESQIEQLLVQAEPILRTRIKRAISAKAKAFLTPDDVLQEASLEAFLQFRQFDRSNPNGFITWVTVIARRKICDAIRAQRTEKRGGRMNQAPVESIVSEITSNRSRSTASRGVRLTEVKSLLQNLIRLLPKDLGTVFSMDLQGCSTADIAASMSKSIGAVYMIRSRAYDALRSLIQDRISEFRTFL